MKTILTSLTFLLFFTSCAQEQSTNTGLQTITWGGKAAVGNYAPEGTLNIKNIQAKIDENTVQSLHITIDMKSLIQENQRLTKHLRNKDFFHVKKYPEATFELTEAFTIGTDKLLTGKMTIKSTSQREQIPVTISNKNDILTITFSHSMNRLDYGITFNSPSVFEKIKENAIADEITLKGTLNIPGNL